MLIAAAGGVVLLISAVVSAASAKAAATGQLRRSKLLGIRTSATLSSDAAWQAGHQSALPWIKTGVLAATIGGLLLLTAPFSDISTPSLVWLGVTSGCVFKADRAAHQAAKDLPATDGTQ
jgi:hypothetical protein